MPGITLRYFDCRGRAQPLRFFLRHHAVSFVDERVPFTDGWQAWAAMKADPHRSGPFGKLPVLVWDGRLLAETRVIATFLQEQLAPEDAGGGIAEVHSALSDDLGLLYGVLNLDLLAPGAKVTEVAQRAESSLSESFQRYEALLVRGPSPFALPTTGTIAAFALLEVWQLAQRLLGARADSLVEGCPRLRAVLEEVAALPAVEEAGASIPSFWSARSDEPARLAELRALLPGRAPVEP